MDSLPKIIYKRYIKILNYPTFNIGLNITIIKKHFKTNEYKSIKRENPYIVFKATIQRVNKKIIQKNNTKK